MSISIDFESALVWFDCVLCNGSGMRGPEPCECSCGADAVYIGTWLANLAIGAALCMAFYDGFAAANGPRPLLWRPGCRKDTPR